MKANLNMISEKLWEWLDESSEENRKKIWAVLMTETESGQAETAVHTFVRDLLRSAKEKQALAEEQQILLNKWMKEKADAENSLQSVQEELDKANQTVQTMKTRMEGYERQFASLQETINEGQNHRAKLQESEAELCLVKADRDNAWAQFKDREQQLDRTRQELGEVKADRDNAWAQFTDREQQLDRARQELQEVKAERNSIQTLAAEYEHDIELLKKETSEAKEKEDRLRTELANAKQYGAEMAMKVEEADKLLMVRLYKKLHRS